MDVFATIIAGIVGLFVLGFVLSFFPGIPLAILVSYIRDKKKERAERQAEEERATMAEIDSVLQTRRHQSKDVLRFVDDRLCFGAGESIRTSDLESMVEYGASGDDILAEIESRVSSVPGVTLGSNSQVLRSGSLALGSSRITLPARIPEGMRDEHVYIIGKTGSGKTNLLRHMIVQDLEAGHGIGVIAPEQEMITEEILPFIPKGRVNDVIYLNPADRQRPVTLNPLHLERGEDLDLRAGETFAILMRLVGEVGPRADQILRNSIYALTALAGTTLLDLHQLLDPKDNALRKRVIRECTDQKTVEFFRDTFSQLPQNATLPVLNRIDALTRSQAVSNVLCQPKSTLNFRKAIDGGKILLFNLSDGVLGVEASQLLGQLIVSKIQMAIMGRVDMEKSKRRRFYLYVDEFQTFVDIAGSTYEKILSRARKYGLGLVLAHQETGQIPNELLRGILGNVGTMVTFRVSHADAVKLSKEYRNPKEPSEPMPPEWMTEFGDGEAICRIGRRSLVLMTKLFSGQPNFANANQAVTNSRELYGFKPRPTASTARHAESVAPGNDFEDILNLDPEKVF